MAIKVTLRKKFISKGRQSLYLDFYPAIPHPETGKSTRRQFLNMYLFIDKVELNKRITCEKEKGKNVDTLKKLYKEEDLSTGYNPSQFKLNQDINKKYANVFSQAEEITEQTIKNDASATQRIQGDETKKISDTIIRI